MKKLCIVLGILFFSVNNIYGQVTSRQVDHKWLTETIVNWIKEDRRFAKPCLDNSFYNLNLSFPGNSIANLIFYCKDKDGNTFFGNSKAKLSRRSNNYIHAEYYHNYSITAKENGTLPDDWNERVFYPVGSYKVFYDDGRLWKKSEWVRGEIKSAEEYAYDSWQSDKKFKNGIATSKATFQRVNDGKKQLYNIRFMVGFDDPIRVPFSQSVYQRFTYYFENGKIRTKEFYKQKTDKYGEVEEAIETYSEEGKLKNVHIRYPAESPDKHEYLLQYREYDINTGLLSVEAELLSKSLVFDRKISNYYGRRIGYYKFYYRGTEQIKEEGRYSRGQKKEGRWTYYYEDGGVKSHIDYKNDIKDGEEITYYKNGQIASRKHYINNSPGGVFNYWRENGTLSRTEKYDPAKAVGSRRGAWLIQYYYEDGRLSGEGYSRFGKTGPWKYYHQNGRIKDIGEYTANKKHGTWKHFRDDGTLWTIQNWKEGKDHGWFEWFHKDGRSLSTTVNYVEGHRTGERTDYFVNGDIHRILVYADDGRLMNIKQCSDRQGNDLDCGTLKEGNGTLKRYFWENDDEVKVEKITTFFDGKEQKK